MCSCCVVPCTSWNGCLKKWIKTVCRRVVAMETASLEASFQSFLLSDNFLPILPLWTCTIPSWSTCACIKLPVMLQARKQEADLVGQNLGKQRWGCNVLWGSWEELTSPLAQRPSRRPQGRTDSFWPSNGKSCVSPCCECIAPVVLGTIADGSLWEISALCLGTRGALGVEGKKSVLLAARCHF